MQADALSLTFAALADPTRRAILKRLAAGPANVKELSRPFDMSGPAVCKHLRVLERAGLIRRGREAQSRRAGSSPRRSSRSSRGRKRIERCGTRASTASTCTCRSCTRSAGRRCAMPDAGSADLIDDREFAVPRELVFEAWTVAEHFARWFAPHGVEVPLCEIDARPGGEIRFHHRR